MLHGWVHDNIVAVNQLGGHSSIRLQYRDQGCQVAGVIYTESIEVGIVGPLQGGKAKRSSLYWHSAVLLPGGEHGKLADEREFFSSGKMPSVIHQTDHGVRERWFSFAQTRPSL